MQVATLVIAVLGVVMAALSLGWQAATFVLTGGRVKADLRLEPSGSIGALPTGWTEAEKERFGTRLQFLLTAGAPHSFIGILVRNVGRLPVTVSDRAFQTKERLGVDSLGWDQWFGPPLPHRLDEGEAAMWAIDVGVVKSVATAAAQTFNRPLEQISVRGYVSLGNGRIVKTSTVVFVSEEQLKLRRRWFGVYRNN